MTSWPDAFKNLSAEQEGDWINKVYVSPENFAAMTGIRSVIVFGDEGSGKTALRLALTHYASNQIDPPALLIRWQPTPSQDEPREIVRVFIREMLDTCARELLRYIYLNPDLLFNAKKWVQEATAWLVQTHLSSDLDFELGKLDDLTREEDSIALRALLSNKPRMILSIDAPVGKIIEQVSSIIRNLGIQSVWVLVDEMEWIDQDKDALTSSLKAILSTLALFEEPGFSIKMIAPKELEKDLTSARSTIRRRWDPFDLFWSVDDLTKIVEARAAAFLEKEKFEIKELHTSKHLYSWLKKYGGVSPRGWLELTRPLIRFQQAMKDLRPLTREEFSTICRQNLPRLRIDVETNQVFLGHGQVTNLQPRALRFLCTLYSQTNHSSSREALYYRVWEGLDTVPQSKKDDNWVASAQWSGMVDTVINRIRGVIELDPSNPVYLTSARGSGTIRLNHLWG